jgi:uncharacterized protein (TIGR03437 family)
MAMTFDGRYLMVGHNDSQMASVYDLDTYEQQPPIIFPFGHYPKSLAASARAVLALSRKADGSGVIENVDLWTSTATSMSNLGIYENKVNANGVLAAAPNGASILLAAPDGNVMLYNANADTFVASRKDVTSLGGAYAASSYDQYVVDNLVLNSSLVAVHKLETGTGSSSGFVFVGPSGFRSTSPGTAAPGVIQRVDALTGSSIRPTRMVEAPLLPVATTNPPQPFTRTLGTFYNQSAVVALTVSGVTVLPWAYDAAVAPPQIQSVVNAADLTAPVAPGGLISVRGTQLSPVNIATREVPLPTALGESCLTVNGMAVPMLFASSTQVNAQLPFNVDGSAVLVLRTPGGTSDNYNLTISATAPSIFRSGTAGPETGIATVVRLANNQVVTPTNPIHPGDQIVIYATGLGRTDPPVTAGTAAPSDPLAKAIVMPTVQLGGTNLSVTYAGLAPGEVGVYQINVSVPKTVTEGMQVSLTVSQGGSSTTIPVRVVK